jgi:hypothetical protein
VPLAAFSPDGRRVVTAVADSAKFGEARVWNVAVDRRPAEDWLALVRLLAAHEIDATGGLRPLSRERLQEMWHTLRAKYPQDFTVSREAAVAWRQQQIADCVREGNLDAAQFHYVWLIHDIVAGGGD